ncbi:hypothetical protein A9Q87_13490 [Flavobacteriales bacterium 34_180_T64]|nr:hypothetical protein A9Q87_13490 [Flavobacteriales bacterium 34_180_T64]
MKKQKKNETIKGVKNPSKNHLAIILSNYITEDFGFPFGERSLVNYYNSINQLKDLEDINISQLKVITGLCNYLGYDDYEDFIFNNEMHQGEIEKESVTFYNDSKNGKSTITIKPINKNLFKWSVTTSAVMMLLLYY